MRAAAGGGCSRDDDPTGRGGGREPAAAITNSVAHTNRGIRADGVADVTWRSRSPIHPSKRSVQPIRVGVAYADVIGASRIPPHSSLSKFLFAVTPRPTVESRDAMTCRVYPATSVSGPRREAKRAVAIRAGVTKFTNIDPTSKRRSAGVAVGTYGRLTTAIGINDLYGVPTITIQRFTDAFVTGRKQHHHGVGSVVQTDAEVFFIHRQFFRQICRRLNQVHCGPADDLSANCHRRLSRQSRSEIVDGLSEKGVIESEYRQQVARKVEINTTKPLVGRPLFNQVVTNLGRRVPLVQVYVGELGPIALIDWPNLLAHLMVLHIFRLRHCCLGRQAFSRARHADKHQCQQSC